MRARRPDTTAFVERDGVKSALRGVRRRQRPTIVLLPTWSIIHSRFWKAQVPYLARHFRVVTFDGRGCGPSDRPIGRGGLRRRRVRRRHARRDGRHRHRAGHRSSGCRAARRGACTSPPTIRSGSRALFAIGPSCGAGGRRSPTASGSPGTASTTPPRGGRSTTAATGWRATTTTSCEFFFAQMFVEPHSTKQIEDCVEWAARDRSGHAGGDHRRTAGHARGGLPARSRPLCVGCAARCWWSTATSDRIRSHADGASSSPSSPAATLVTIDGGGHGPQARDPVMVNRSDQGVRRSDAGQPTASPSRHLDATRAARRPKRALYLSSPIGLGHARRDVAIAQELRRLHPDLQIDWLAQHPVTRGARRRRRAGPPGLGMAGERVGAHRRRVRRARPARLPGDPPDGRDPRQQLHGVPRRRRGRATTTS